MVLVETFLPPGIAPGIAVLLLFASVLTSMITAAFGAGGGLMLLGIMAQFLPPVALVAVHGLIQLGSNAGRFVMTWRHADWGVLSVFAPGVVLGMTAGALVLVRLPEMLWQLIIAGFILWLIWGPPIPKAVLGRGGIFVASSVTSFASLFVGATGPSVAVFIKQLHTDHLRAIATFSGAMTFQHLPKVLVFGVTGFAFPKWILWVLLMIGCGLLGTWLGLRVARRMTGQHFHRLLDGILTLLALRLIWQALA